MAGNKESAQRVELPKLTLNDITKSVAMLHKNTRDGLKSCFPKLDESVGGAWRDGIAISGTPGAGKTMLCLNMIGSFLQQKARVILMDIENLKQDTIKRIILILLNLILGENSITEGDILFEPTCVSQAKHVKIFNEFLLPYLSLVTPVETGKITPELIEKWIQIGLREREQDGRQVVFVLDSFNVLAQMFPYGKSLYESIEKWLASLMWIRNKYEIPMFLICHRTKAEGADIFNPKGSSGIAHFARTQMVVMEDPEEQKKVIVRVVRAQFGRKKTLELNFLPPRCRLVMAEGDDESPF